MAETAKVKLGNTELTVNPLTLGQMKKLGMGAVTLLNPSTDNKVEQEEHWYASNFNLISIATGKTAEEIEAIPGAVRSEIISAVDVILRLAGLITDKKDEAPKTPGEVEGAGTG